MGRSQKRSGSRWEREAAKELSKHCGKWKRVPGSGALGTQLGDSSLLGDLVGYYPWFKQPIKAEAKFGYGGSKQITVKRSWIVKIRDQAGRAYAALILKFKGVYSGDPSAKLIVFDFETWHRMMNDLEDLWEEHLVLLEAHYGR